VYHIHNGDVPKIDNFGISFNLLLNLVSVCNSDDKSVLWGFISRYAPSATPENAPYLDHMTSFAINYYNDFIKNAKSYLAPTQKHKLLLAQIDTMLSKLPDESTSEEIQNQIYAIGRDAGYENLRDFFKELYQILLGQIEGPRLGSFIKLFGIEDTRKLIRSKIQ
jgi:lysyl-tRNA synthetase class 1